VSVRRRLDLELVRRGLVDSRQQAQAAVAAGSVLVGGAVADNSSRLVSPADAVIVRASERRFVSRGGEKLEAALDRFDIDVAGRRALDVGASTGGFTDCLLQRGACSVTAVDVGRGQLHPRLATDRRVHSLERTNIRYATVAQLGGRPFEVVVADLSFISLRTVAPVLLGPLAAERAAAVFLVKPQFEAGRAEVSKGRGVIRDPAVWSKVLVRVLGTLEHERAAMMGLMVSPVTGADGNVEFLAHLQAHRHPAGPSLDLAAVVDEALRRHGAAS